MMPELGKYAGAVLASYGLSLLILGGLVLISVIRSRRVARALREVEERINNG